MRVIKESVKREWEQNYKKEEFIHHIIEHILSICKNEDFSISNRVSRVEKNIENTQNKIKNKDELLLKSNEMRKSLVDRISELEDENFQIKVKLLESLGSID